MKSTEFLIQSRISIVIPAYNEEVNLPILMEEIHSVLQKSQIEAEIIFVNDASTDKSLEAMLQLQQSYGMYDVMVLTLNRNCGLSTALDAGFHAATSEIIVSIDSDLQNDPADIPKLLQYIPEYDAVIGIRARRNDSFVKRMSSKIANTIRDRFLREKWRDTGCTLKAYKKSYLIKMPLLKGMHRFLPTLLQMHGARVLEVDVNHRARIHGVPKYNLWNRLLGPFMDLLAVRWMKNRHISYSVTTAEFHKEHSYLEAS